MDYEFIRGQFTEAELESAIITLFEQQDYIYVHGDGIHRRNEDILLENDLRSFLSGRYSDLTEFEAGKIISRLRNIPTTPLYQGNKEAFWLVNEGFDLERDDIEKLPIHVDYIDYDNPYKNIFKVVNQFTVVDTRERRPDLLLFVNGIPVTIFEFKSAINEGTTIADAHRQITVRYNRDIPKLMKTCFLSVISDGANTRLGTIFTPYEYYYAWNKVDDKERVADGISSLLTIIKGAFAKERILAILRDFVFYPNDDRKYKAVVARYPQFFAANKILTNIKEHLKPNGDGKGGTYFGATGCGKTMIMLFLARLIGQRARDTFNNPTIVVITDREDLDTQASELFANAQHYLKENENHLRSIESRLDLQDVLSTTESGGVYITTIQKFCETTGLLSTRNNIICISDSNRHGSKAEKDR